MKNTIKAFSYVLSFLFTIAVVALDTCDLSSLESAPYYKATVERISQLKPVKKQERQLKVGWGKANIVPDFEFNVIGFNKNGKCKDIHDSLSVRVIIYDDGEQKIAQLSYDLLMVHPIIEEQARSVAEELGIDHVYMCCTHTHNGYGGWAKGLAAKFILGGYDPHIIDLLRASTKKVMAEALSVMEEAEIFYTRIDQNEQVRHRIDPGNPVSRIDPWVRILKFKTKSNKTVLLTTFSAHATSLDRWELVLSGDYPAAYNQMLESKPDIDFSMFCAGGVGSHKPLMPDYNFENMTSYARNLVDTAYASLKHMEHIVLTTLAYEKVPVDLRSPHLRLTNDIRIKESVFNALIGEVEAHLTYLQLGDVVFVGGPGDISGELMPAIQRKLKDKNLKLFLTSFNGAYMGYVTHDYYYNDYYHFEVREMNWFGPYNGAYFTELVSRIVNTKNVR